MNTIRPTDYLSKLTGDIFQAPTWPIIWSNMDYLIHKAEQEHMYIILELSDMRNILHAEEAGKNYKSCFAYDPKRWTQFLQFVGKRYSKSPAILYYPLAGEIHVSFNGKYGSHCQVPVADITHFYDVASKTLYQADGGHHLISTGGLSHLDKTASFGWWQNIFSLPHINVVALHPYDTEDQTLTVPLVAQWAQAHNKPLVFEEFGSRQGRGDQQRAQQFQQVYDLAAKYLVAGKVFWNLGPEIASRSDDVNQNTPSTWKTVINNAP